MSTWSKGDLRKIAGAEDLHIAPFREDGVTYGTPAWIWSVAVDDALLRCGRRRDESLQPACRKGSSSNQWTGRLTDEVSWQSVPRQSGS